MMTIREYKQAESLEEAWQLNQKKANRVLGGMIWLKMENINVGTAIDLSGLGLDTIEETEGSFSIGAMVTLRQLEEHAGLAAYTHGAVKEALRHIVGVQLRNLATVGGSIYSRFGFSDVLTLFMAMDCSVELYKGGIISLQEYAERPYDRDILVRLIVKKEEAEFFYQSVRNSQTDIPVLTCAAARLENGSYRIAIGARPLKAVLFELPAKAGVSAQELAQNFADEVKQKIVTGSNMRGNAEYRRHLAGVLTKRAVLELKKRACIEQRPNYSACRKSVGSHYYFRNGYYPCQGSIFYKGYYFVAHRRNYSLYHLQKYYLKKYLRLCHTENLPCLVLTF